MATRVVKAHTPLGEEQLLFRSMHGNEGLSQLFEFEVDLLSPNTSVDMKAVLGKPLTLEIVTINGAPRYLNGQITRFTMIGREGGSSRYTVYRASVRPWLWYLTRTSDCKIFQNKSVVEILEEVLGEYGFAFEKKLSASYRQWEYCVQYQETDFAFVSRLMEHEGIYYYFKHEKNQHTLVLADDMGAHEPLPEYPKIGYLATDRVSDPGREVIDQWEVTEEIRPGTYVVDDFDFKKPKADLLTTAASRVATITASTRCTNGWAATAMRGRASTTRASGSRKRRRRRSWTPATPTCAAWPRAIASPCRTRRATRTTAST
jgi:type VI secretion system secreted protein VgrG